MMCSMKRNSAFTLIELLVVIAIISLLVSILLPSLQNAKELAKGVVCSSQLKNLGMTFAFYAEDNEGRLPLNWTSGGGTRGNIWTTLIAPYWDIRVGVDCLESEAQLSQHLGCPSEEPPAIWKWWYSDYSINGYLFPQYGTSTTGSLPANLLAEVASQNPSGRMQAMDSNGLMRNCTAISILPVRYGLPVRHYGENNPGLNVLYFDNHVERISDSEVPLEEDDPFWQ